MTIKSSGTLSIQEINAEFGRGNDLNAYRGTTYWTDSGSSGTFPSGTIGVDSFYGKRATAPILTIEYLLVGGGGGGGAGTYDFEGGGGGGGGGGGVRTGTVNLYAGVTYYFSIGQGGAGGYLNTTYITGYDNYNNPYYGNDYVPGRSGTSTSFYNNSTGAAAFYSAVNGGEPGLARWITNYSTKNVRGGQYSTPYRGGNAGGYSIYGNAGGEYAKSGGSDGIRGGGGGGGIDDANATGHGGNGVLWAGTYYAGGGGGGGDYTYGGVGGLGGGGNGGSGGAGQVVTNGSDGFGGGGGGGASYGGRVQTNGGRGGSGILVFRYPGSRRKLSPSTSLAYVYSIGGYTYHGYTQSGNFTADISMY